MSMRWSIWGLAFFRKMNKYNFSTSDILLFLSSPNWFSGFVVLGVLGLPVTIKNLELPLRINGLVTLLPF